MKNDKTHVFYAFRYFLVKNAQVSMFENDLSPINELISNCIREKQILAEINGKNDLLIFVNKYDENTFLFKFCRDFPITKYINDDNKKDIVEVTESNYPYIYVIINTVKQIVLIEKKTSLYFDSTAVKNTFKSFVEYYLHDLNFTFSMDEIVNLSTFWDIVSKAEKIFELRLNLRSPNLFGAALSTNELLKKVKEKYNNDEIEMRMKNTNGNLTIDKEDLEDAIKYAGGGGGSWKISITNKNQNKKETIDSKKGIKTVEITNLESELKIETTNEVIDTVNRIDDILKDESL